MDYTWQVISAATRQTRWREGNWGKHVCSVLQFGIHMYTQKIRNFIHCSCLCVNSIRRRNYLESPVWIESRHRSLCIATMLQAGQSWGGGGGLGIFIFTTASRTALEPTQPPNQWVPRALSLGATWPGRETDHSPPSSAEAKNVWRYTFTPNTSSWFILPLNYWWFP
jgi:hypothetical protein